MLRFTCFFLLCTACAYQERVDLCRADVRGDQCTRFGQIYAFDGDENDQIIAADFYRMACDKKYGEGCYQLSKNKEYITLNNLDAEKILSLKEDACYSAYLPACQDLGFQSAQDLKNQRNSQQWLERCQSEHMESCYLLGDLYANARGFDAKRWEAAELYTRSCRGGFDSGCKRLGFQTRDAFLEHERREQATRIEEDRLIVLAQSCRLGQHQKCFEAAQAYSESTLIERDEERIFLLYQRACDGGEIDGCIEVAVRYTQGRGVVKDEVRAVALYQRACDLGRGSACVTLARIFEDGLIVSKDLTAAAQAYQRACTLGANADVCERSNRLKSVLSIGDDKIRRQIIKDSIDSYDGPCPCPYNYMRNGRQCGDFSAWSRPGGASPVCYGTDITDEAVDIYRESLLYR